MALKQVRVARILHLTVARVLEARARARPLPGRCAGYTEAELRALHDEVRVEDHPLTRTTGSWAWDEDQGLWADQAEATVVHAADVEASQPADRAEEEDPEDVFGFGGGLDNSDHNDD